jgi:hypothetical protein
MRDPRLVWHCERHDRVLACGAGYINCGVRCHNDGVAAGLYSQPCVVVAKWIGCIVDGHTIRNDGDVSAARSDARGISGADGIAPEAGCASWDGDNDTRLKREPDIGEPPKPSLVSTLMPLA